MSVTTLSLLQKIAVQANLDLSDASQKTLALSFLNMAYQDLQYRFPWPWLQCTDAQKTVPDEDVTLSIANGSAVVTGASGQFAVGFIGRYMLKLPDENWYLIHNVNSAGDKAEISPAYLSTTNTAASCILRKRFYDLSSTANSDVDNRLYSVYFPKDNTTIIPTFRRDVELADPNGDTAGSPTSLFVFGSKESVSTATTLTDSATASSVKTIGKFAFYPTPDEEVVFHTRLSTGVPDLSADSDVPQMPQAYALTALLWGALAWALNFNKLNAADTRADMYSKRYEDKIEEMRAVNFLIPSIEKSVQAKEFNGAPTTRIPYPGTYPA